MRGRANAFAVVATTAFALLVAVAPPAAAATCVHPGNFFAGTGDTAYKNSTPVEGAMASIVVHGNTLCTGATQYNEINAWSMISDINNELINYHYAQAGYLSNLVQGGSYYVFTEYSSTGTPTFALDSYPITAGGSYQFWTQYLSSCGCERMNVNTHVLAQTNFNPFATWQTPFTPEFFNESFYAENNTLGTVTYPVTYSNHMYQDYVSDNFYPAGCTLDPALNDEPGYWEVVKVSCDDYHVYTHIQR